MLRVEEKGIGITGRLRFVFRNIETGAVRESEYRNLIVTLCKEMIAARLAGGGGDCDITYVAVGTDATTPAIGDTALGTELDRNALASISAAGSVITATGFFGAAEANGTLTEMGLFGEAASATPDSGTLINHAAISETKTSSETMTIECTLTIE